MRRRSPFVLALSVFVLATLLLLAAAPVARARQAPLLLRAEERRWDPTAEPLREKVTRLPHRAGEPAGVRVYAVRFHSHDWRAGRPVLLFGFYACPADAGPDRRRPGVLLVHGGGGYATRERTVQAAARGFAALSIDLPGKGTSREGKSRSSGPDMTVANIFNAWPDPRESYVYHAVRAQRRALTFLGRRPEADPARLGLVGVSWGGATGLLTTATDARVRCFVDIFGAGYVREGSCWLNHFAALPPGAFEAWERNFDARWYAPQVRVPVYAVTATNDGCYWLPQFLKTTRALDDATLLLLPNQNHRIDEATHSAVWKWLALRLAAPRKAPGSRSAAGKLDVARRLTERAGADGRLERCLEVTFRSRDAVTARMAWSPVRAGEGHAARVWQESALRPLGRGVWRALVPTDGAELTYLFATVRRADGLLVSTPVHTAMRRHSPAGGPPVALAAPIMTNRPGTVLARQQAGTSHSANPSQRR